ncbi:MAG: phosphotransferase family protein, partial [Halioglobus sp.]|nr:phosphotransferase family protein [Halioglobus sp.]
MPLTQRPTVHERLQQTLAQWRHWQCPQPLTECPEVEGPLQQGHSNPSFLVSCGQRFVVRLDGVDTRLNGINRQAEWRILDAAHRSGLAPHPCYFNPDLGSLVCSYLPGDAPARFDPVATAGLLRRIHALPAVHQRLHLAERIGRYARRLPREHAEWLAPAGQSLSRLLALTAGDRSPAVLCHNDLLRANRLLSGGRLYALDWEYAAMGPPLYDLAVLM